MRIAFSGSHRVGKSTLIERVGEALPHYTVVAEPYYLLAEEGYEASEMPSLDDFEAQFERCLVAMEAAAPDVLFDRSPADIVAYLVVHNDAAPLPANDWLERIRDAMTTLDFVVFVPIEEPDRIALPSHEDGQYRATVDEKLRELLVDDALGLEIEVLTVQGDVRARVDHVMARIRGAGAHHGPLVAKR